MMLCMAFLRAALDLGEWVVILDLTMGMICTRQRYVIGNRRTRTGIGNHPQVDMGTYGRMDVCMYVCLGIGLDIDIISH